MNETPLTEPASLSSVKRELHPIVVIRSIVAKISGIGAREMQSDARPEHIAIPRMIAMHLCVKRKEGSLTTIGSFFGNRDHTTVIHANKKISDLPANDRYRRLLERCERKVNEVLGPSES